MRRRISLALGVLALAVMLPSGKVPAAPSSWPDLTGSSYSRRPPGVPADGHPGQNGPLSASERQLAETAWLYFVNNLQPATGLVNAVDAYPSGTLWDMASYVGGLLSAYDLGLVQRPEVEQRLDRLLSTLGSLPLFRGLCPNKAYDTRTAITVTYANEPGEIGCSALDIGRLLVWLDIVKLRFPAQVAAVNKAVSRWNFCRLVRPGGELYGIALGPDGNAQDVQEGRLGYEEYSAKGFARWGFDTTKASSPEPLDLITMYGIDVAFDARDPRVFHAHNYVVSESYVLDGIEFNWDKPLDTDDNAFRHSDGWVARLAQHVYEVQEARYDRTGILTARTEHQLDTAPYFVYDTVFSDGYPWNTITDEGAYEPKFAAVASKGAVGLWALWDTAYTARLMALVQGLEDKAHGILEGAYEDGRGPIKTFTANNNGIILEALAYKVKGKLVPPPSEAPRWADAAGAELRQSHCLPSRPAS